MSSAGNANARTACSKKMWVGVPSIIANQGCEMQQVWCDYWDSSHFAALSRDSPFAPSPPLTPPSPFPWSPWYRPAPSSLWAIPSPNRSNDEKVTLSSRPLVKCFQRCEPVLFSCSCICRTCRGQVLCNRDLKHFFFFSLKGNIIWRRSILNIKLDFHSSQSLDSVWWN